MVDAAAAAEMVGEAVVIGSVTAVKLLRLKLLVLLFLLPIPIEFINEELTLFTGGLRMKSVFSLLVEDIPG